MCLHACAVLLSVTNYTYTFTTNPSNRGMAEKGIGIRRTLGSAVRMETQKSNGTAGTLEAVVAAAHETAGAFSSLERQLRHSKSFSDVQAVDAGHALSPPPLKKIRINQGSQSLLDTSLKAVQEDENEVAEVVVVCEPEGTVMPGWQSP